MIGTCREQDASLARIWHALHFGRIEANADVVTSTYTYDSNGNLTSGAGWGYTWDYLNRMLSSGFGGSTTTYAYDATGNRVLQTSTTSTTFYPSKFYSFASMLVGSTTYATSTNYIWNGDTLLATIDQPMVNGAATGTAVTRYIHPDHLGSTNAVTDQNGYLVQTLDYYPFGATRVSTSTYPTNEKRGYIDQFSDAQTGLIYDNARYYNPNQGQFLSEEPISQSLGDANQVAQLSGQSQQSYLADPQKLNSYSYGRDNPITRKDTTGLQADPFSLSAELALTAPEWGPVVASWGAPILAGIGASASYITADTLLRQNGGMRFVPFSQQKGRLVQLPGAPSLFPTPGEGPEKPPDNKWLRRGLAGTLLVDLASSAIDPLNQLNNSIQSYLQSLRTNNQNISNQRTQSFLNAPSNSQWRFGTPSNSSLPTAITQNGITYTRNSSGLLNVSSPSK